jgi:hypothetical protein
MLSHHFDRFLTEYKARFEREYGYAGGRAGGKIHDPAAPGPGEVVIPGARGQGWLLIGLECGRPGDKTPKIGSLYILTLILFKNLFTFQKVP